MIPTSVNRVVKFCRRLALLCSTCAVIAIVSPVIVRGGPMTVATTSPSNPATQPDAFPNPYASADAEPHMDAEYDAAFADIEVSLGRCPPSLVVSPERRDALTMLDLIFHDPYAPERKPVQDFHVHQAQATADALEHDAPPEEGAKIYMFYNMGFIVRTRTVTIGFDLVRMEHMDKFALPDDLMKRVINQCDVLFISHVHLDHADPWVAQTAIDEGKPVVAPPDLWSDQPIGAHLTKLKRDSSLRQTVTLHDGRRELNVIANPGFQNLKTGDGVTNNVYVVQTPDGMLFAHTGDNNAYVPSGMNWTDPEHPNQQIDVLLLNDWTMTLAPKTMRGYNPRLVIAGHFNELGHPNVLSRAPYWRGLVHGTKSIYPWLVMTWGESFTYRRDAMPAGPAAQAAAH
jgi:L-ascorbate metabolism protein UlaG (beta-lactamase superfamily)